MSASSGANGSANHGAGGRFTPGNRAALRHGGRSQRERQRVRSEVEQGIRDRVLTRWSHLADLDFMTDLLIDALADVVHLRAVIQEYGGPVNPRGHVYRAMQEKRAREHDAFQYAAALLLPPREVAKLGAAAGLGEPAALMATAAQERLRARVAAAQPSAVVAE